MTALQRLELITKECPANLSGLTALTKLKIGDLEPWNEITAYQLEVGIEWRGTLLHARRRCPSKL